ncbi:MAG: nitrous oxide-stimulated promoter family protein [Geobacteraceae bacterium]|nr:nitrous oxide-stimulated promoter family protein [Geobacteraceae bacterium]
MNNLTAQQIKDLKVLAEFISLYCHAKHAGEMTLDVNIPDILQKKGEAAETLCPECAMLLEHGIEKRVHCPMNPKPTCKSCHIHCYTSEYRLKIRKIMAYSGRRMILRGRVDYIWHYFTKS